MKPIIRYTCKKCTAKFLIGSTDANVHLLRPAMDCPHGHGRMKRDGVDVGKSTGTLMDAVSFYRACLGQGLPSERECSPKRMKALLTGKMIEKVELASSPDTKRSLILSLTLESGERVFFANSSLGATLYKVTKE